MNKLFKKKSSLGDEGENDQDDDHHINNLRSQGSSDTWNPNNAPIIAARTNNTQQQEDEFGMNTRANNNSKVQGTSSAAGTAERPNYRGFASKPTAARGRGRRGGRGRANNNEEVDEEDEVDDDAEEDEANAHGNNDFLHDDDDDDEEEEDTKGQKHIEKSAGTSRLNRILRDATTMSTSIADTPSSAALQDRMMMSSTSTYYRKDGSYPVSSSINNHNNTHIEKVSNIRNIDEVGNFVGRLVIPPLRLDTQYTGHMLDTYPISIQQEAIYVGICHHFESISSVSSTTTAATTGTTSSSAPVVTATTTTSETIYMSALQYPNEYNARKRSLGLYSTTSSTTTTMMMMGGGGGIGLGGNKYRMMKLKYIIIGRSTNHPLLETTKKRQMETIQQKLYEIKQQQQQQDSIGATTATTTSAAGGKSTSNSSKSNSNKKKRNNNDDSDRVGDYDTMFAPEDDDEEEEEGDDDDYDDEDDEGNNDVDNDRLNEDNNREADDVVGNHSNDEGGASSNKKSSTTMTGNDPNNNEKRKSVKIVLNDDENDAQQEGGGGGIKKNVHIEDEEISSFPVLICMTLQTDGTGPDIRKLIPLDQLTTIQDLNSTIVQLAFTNGDTIRIDFGTGIMETFDNSTANANTDGALSSTEQKSGSTTIATSGGTRNNNNISMERSLDKERFIWSLLQIHATLCVSVVERYSRGTKFLPPLNVRNVDRAELQYIATINGFIQQNESIRILLEHQRKLFMDSNNETATMMMMTSTASSESKIDSEAQKQQQSQKAVLLDMDEMAYDLMMGNFATRVTLFHSDDERKDAEEILNSSEWTELISQSSSINNNNGTKDETTTTTGNTTTNNMNIAERLTFMLQSRMRDLEAETCRRLIAWEDEKSISVSGNMGSKLHDSSDARDTVDALALASLFKTLESLDNELKSMEDWLQERAAAIKPLTDDCADIEEENRQLEQQWKSYDMLGNELKRLLHGQELDEATENILKNPASVLVYDDDGLVNVDDSEDGIERLYEAGKALLDAIEFPRKCGGIHLKAVAERAKGLTSISNTFCSSLAQIIVTVMEQFKNEVIAGSDHGKVSKSDTHTMISKKVRDTQRKFQSALLTYIKLIEILAALSPDMLPALRDAYSEMVAEGILMKKRMKGYFQALPGKNTACLNKVGKNIKDYAYSYNEAIVFETVNAPDIRAVLSELLPVIAREAYFTSALFGSMNREQDGREKKRNFENAKNAVDKASIHFRYYLNRTCGVVDTNTNEGGDGTQKGDPLLCLVATIYLNEIMDSYIDREKKGGDHSLSLAYVRATILDLRKKADKQWVTWVEQQIEWIKSNDGVPITGKRAGIFPSFARFPIYLDHMIKCCKEGREEDYFPDLPGIKVINYYLQKIAVTLLESLKECARRDTTDQAYASHVMQMENTYFFTQAVKNRGDVISKLFAKQVIKANAICKESTDAYLGWMIKREFTALHELFSRVSKIRKEMGDNDVVSHVPKIQFIKTLQKEANRDVLKEKIGTMYSRMEKHLSEEGQLLPIAWKALVKVLYEWFGRWEKLCTSIYNHKLDPSSVDVVRIAKAAGGTAGSATTPGNTTKGGASVGASSEGGSEFGFKSILALGAKQQQQGPKP